MSKVVTSPSTTWPGTVTLSDPFLLPQVELIEAALEYQPDGEKVWLTVIDKKRLPAIFDCVETWNLQNFPDPSPTLETFPMTPRPESNKLITWLWDEIRNIYLGELEVPNAS